MSILRYNESVEGRKATTSFDNGPKSSYTRVFQIITDSVVTDLNDIKNLAGTEDPLGSLTLPDMGDGYPSDPGTSVSNIEASTEDGRLKYFLTFQYTNPPPSGHGHNPPGLEWAFSTDVIEQQVITDRDFGGHQQEADPRQIRNSAGDIFDPPLMEVEYFYVINLSKFFSTWDMEQAMDDRQNLINSTDVTILGFTFPKHSLLCQRWTTGGKQQVNGGTYFKLDTRFIYRPPFVVESQVAGGDPAEVTIPGWNRAVIDQGFNISEGGARFAPVDDRNKTPEEIPSLFDGQGGVQPSDKYNPFYFEFRTKGQSNMTNWGLPRSINRL